MPTIFCLLVLSVVQGLTEFLPISSKTHLLFARHFLGMDVDLFFDIVLHVGSLLAVLVYYRRAWWELVTVRRREILPLALASIPLVLAALLLRRHVKPLYENLTLASAMLLVTAAWLFVSDRHGRERHGLAEAPLWKLLLMGVAQAFAVLPGISRSGSTIGAGFLCGLKRADAVRFSFFLGAVAIAGAAALMGKEALAGEAPLRPMPILVGTSVTFAVSLAAIRAVEILSSKGRFSGFALYCAAAGVAGMIYFSLARG
jgi:undecaprenyl-diphosphatase